jgi:Mrp family chromosome partitioning ATPase
VVERLKEAVEKARRQREAGQDTMVVQPARQLPQAPPAAWDLLPVFTPDPVILRRHRLVAYDRSHPSYGVFDVLRTRLGKVFQDRRWTTLGVLSPTKGCGKTTVAANLAFSLGRGVGKRAALIDLDMRQPRLATDMGYPDRRSIAGFLRGEADVASSFVRVGDGVAIGFNTVTERDSAELLQAPATAQALRALTAALAPSMLIVDLPPMLACDDAVGLLPALDAVIIVAAAGQTRANEIEDCERLIGDASSFLGVILNKHDADPDEVYLYDYGPA